MLELKEDQIVASLKNYGFCACVAKIKHSRLHGHGFLEFSYIEEGKIEHSFGGRTEILGPGDYFIVDYGSKHEYKSADGGDVSVINLLFYPDFLDRTLSRDDNFEKVVNSYLVRFKYRTLRYSPTGIRFFDEDNEICNIVQNILREFISQRSGYLEYIRCLLVQIFIITMRKIVKEDIYPTESEIIKEIANTVKNNYEKKLNLAAFAKQYNYSLSHISKKFTDEMGIGFTEYLQRIRIEHACILLEGSDIPISEVASGVGYANMKFFNKIFKKTLGVTPREFKRISKSH